MRERRGRPPNTAPTSIDSVGLDPDVVPILRREGIQTLYPPQAAAIPPMLAGSSLLVACPTASGKSLIAYLALLRAFRAGKTGLYLVPLRALAQEKFDELQSFAELGVKVGLSIGDFDLAAPMLERLDILVATSEKADALLRKGAPWLDRLGVVVADEVHLLRDPDRGPTLEVSLTRLRRHHRDLQVVALSATVGNARELAAWLGAEAIESEFRPVPLRSGVYHDGTVTFTDLSTRAIEPPGEPVPRLVRTVIEEGGQALVFVSTRRASDQLAHALVPTVRALLSRTDRAATESAAHDLAELSEEETEGARRLAELLPHGVAFHNASLTNAERRLVERAFRDRVLRALVATPTLAAGINLPARRVIVRDTTRYDDRLGLQAPIPALEVQQMCGRAGRPRFDTTGEAVLIARTIDEEERFLDQYLSAAPETVSSRLAAEPALRMHVLALVASGEVASEEELESFFTDTFYGHTLPLAELTDKVRTVRDFLERHEFLLPGSALRATRFGSLTSELYLDPMSALVLRHAIERAPIGVPVFPVLAAIAATPDLPPVFLRRGEESEMLSRYTDEEPGLLVRPEEEPYELDLDLFLSTMKTAMILESWIDETPLVDLTDRFGIGAGDLRAKVEDADWLLFGASRLAAHFNKRVARPIDDLALRVRYGVREELLDLVRVRGIGRVRARALFGIDIPDRDTLKAAPRDRIVRALGSPRIADQIMREVGHPGAPEAPVGASTTRPTPPTRLPAGRPTRRLEEFPEEPASPPDR